MSDTPKADLPPDEFEKMLPKAASVTVYSRREHLVIWPIKLTQITVAMRACAPIIAAAQKLTPNMPWWPQIQTMLLQNLDKLPVMLAACTGKPIEYFTGDDQNKELELDEYMAITEVVFHQNLDFFTRRVLPNVLQVAALLVARLPKRARPIGVPTTDRTGPTPSKPSSARVTLGGTSKNTHGDNSSAS